MGPFKPVTSLGDARHFCLPHGLLSRSNRNGCSSLKRQSENTGSRVQKDGDIEPNTGRECRGFCVTSLCWKPQLLRRSRKHSFSRGTLAGLFMCAQHGSDANSRGCCVSPNLASKSSSSRLKGSCLPHCSRFPGCRYH